eukprot:2303026-Amphidinium_carterae.1
MAWQPDIMEVFKIRRQLFVGSLPGQLHDRLYNVQQRVRGRDRFLAASTISRSPRQYSAATSWARPGQF